MLLILALNGARPKKQNPFIPQALDEIEREIRLLFDYGCNVFHVHCYDKNGIESLKPNDVNKLVALVKDISHEIQIGISSGEWIESDLDKRKSYIRGWNNDPDFVSVNMIEDNAIDISKILISKGIKIEAGLNEKKAAEIFVKSNLMDYCCRILVEPEAEDIISAMKTINEIEYVLNKHDVITPRLLHGFNDISWRILEEAKRRGYDGRIGMEDTIYLENGEMVKSNLELIQCANKILNNSGGNHT